MNTRALFLVVACALLAVSLSAQESTEASRGPDGGTRFRVAGIEVLPVAGRPFSGTDTIEWTHNLEDGSVVTTHLTAVVARDGQGRIYRERRNFVPANTSQQSKLIDKIFYDPNAHTKTTCTVATHQCSITGYYAPASFTPAAAGPRDNGKGYLTREGLGNNTLEDLNVVGTVETLKRSTPVPSATTVRSSSLASSGIPPTFKSICPLLVRILGKAHRLLNWSI